jgi:hypothetical protein
MAELTISDNSRSEDLAALALAVNEILQLPVTLRSAKVPGVRVEEGKVVDDEYSGPVLEEVLKEGRTIRTVPRSGAYKEIPVAVAPIKDKEGRVIAAIGVVDVVGSIDLPAVFGAYTEVKKQVTRKR